MIGRTPTGRILTRRTVILALPLIALAGLSACGKRGDPHLPEGEVGSYPRAYPDPATVRPSTVQPAPEAGPEAGPEMGANQQDSEEQTN